ncbi:MAG: type II toxin-antitoxin system VapC family toxin [Rhizomicrobium sp.]
MIVLDTNVVSEATHARPSAAVRSWLGLHVKRDLFITTVTEAEMLSGLHIMAHGRRREALTEQIHAIFEQEFAGRILPFDSAAAREFAPIARIAGGKPVMEPDRQIAAIARACGAAVATRNLKHFTGCGLRLIDPWTSEERT